MALCEDRIKELTSTKGVDAIAVNNFLSSMESHATRADAHLILDADAASNKWNPLTRKAIRTGIREYFQK